MLSDELSSDMDRITQLQDAILDLLTITATSIEYITQRTQFEQTSKEIPQTLTTAQAAPRQEYRESIETFVKDIVRRSKDVETLIVALPRKDDSSDRICLLDPKRKRKREKAAADNQAKRLNELRGEMNIANEEYKEALAQAEELLKELEQALGAALTPAQVSLSKAVATMQES